MVIVLSSNIKCRPVHTAPSAVSGAVLGHRRAPAVLHRIARRFNFTCSWGCTNSTLAPQCLLKPILLPCRLAPCPEAAASHHISKQLSSTICSLPEQFGSLPIENRDMWDKLVKHHQTGQLSTSRLRAVWRRSYTGIGVERVWGNKVHPAAEELRHLLGAGDV